MKRITMIYTLALMAFFANHCVMAEENGITINKEFFTAYSKANGTPKERQEIVDLALKYPQYTPSVMYFIAARNAYVNGKLEDAGFFFFAAQARGALELFQYPQPPGGSGTVIPALRQTIGHYINPAIMEPTTYSKITSRIDKWEIMPARDYISPFKSSKPKSYDEAKAKGHEIKDGLLAYMKPMSKLLGNHSYYQALKEIQRYNLVLSSDDRMLKKILFVMKPLRKKS